MKIGICDDEKFVHEEVAELIQIFCKKYHEKYSLFSFTSAEQLLKSTEKLDCLLLDIQMPGLDGISAAKLLRKKGKNYPIIMLTSRDDRFKEAFEIGAFRFVTKPIEREELFRSLEAFQIQNIKNAEIEAYWERRSYRLKVGDILYITSCKSHSLIYSRKKEYRSEYSLKQWMERLDSRLFFQCHKSYIVNLSMIDTIESGRVSLVDGEKILVSRREQTALRKAYMQYDTQ